MSSAYENALAWARGLKIAGFPLEFPDERAYIKLVAELPDVRFDLDPDEADFHSLPEEYELAYLTAKLERLRARIKAEKGLDVAGL